MMRLRSVTAWVGEVVVALVLIGAGGTLWVEREAVVLYHPSRDARFSDELSQAIVDALAEDGFLVERATVTSRTPDAWPRARVIVLVSNTYWWTPDRPTLRYLERVRWEGVPVIGVMAGAGSTGRAERLLAERLRGTGARLRGTRSAWIFRPNDETRLGEPNRVVASEVVAAWVQQTVASWDAAAGG